MSSFHLWTIIAFGACLLAQIDGKPPRVEKICENGVLDETLKKTCCTPTMDEDLITKNCLATTKVIEDYKDEKEAAINLSAFVECVYSKKKYIKTDSQLNMEQIIAEAKLQYSNDTQQQSFVANMYRHCGKKATKIMRKLNSDPQKADLLEGLHKPYFMHIYTCVLRYSLSKCPYFRWNAEYEYCRDWTHHCKGICIVHCKI